MDLLLSGVGVVWDQVGEVVTLVSTSAILMIPIAFKIVGKSVGVGKSLMGTRRR